MNKTMKLTSEFELIVFFDRPTDSDSNKQETTIEFSRRKNKRRRMSTAVRFVISCVDII